MQPHLFSRKSSSILCKTYQSSFPVSSALSQFNQKGKNIFSVSSAASANQNTNTVFSILCLSTTLAQPFLYLLCCSVYHTLRMSKEMWATKRGKLFQQCHCFLPLIMTVHFRTTLQDQGIDLSCLNHVRLFLNHPSVSLIYRSMMTFISLEASHSYGSMKRGHLSLHQRTDDVSYVPSDLVCAHGAH